jgi:subtilase family serine protease
MRILDKALAFALSIATAGAAAPAGAALANPLRPVPQMRLASPPVHGARRLARPLGPHSIAPLWARLRGGTALCEQAERDHAACFAAANLATTVPSAAPAAVYGLTPDDLSSLYAYPQPGAQGRLGAGATVAIVVAHDYVHAERDLAVYRSYYKLPPCSSASGCLSKVGAAAPAAGGKNAQSISANPTSPNEIGWAAEADIDMDVTSAVCPNCRIVLAEAKSDSLSDLANAVSAALQAGASIVNASYGARESLADPQINSVYENGRVKIVASSGDWGYGVYYPAADPDVIAVGGTSLDTDGTHVTETVWGGTGSGCSAVFAKPLWQLQYAFAWGPCLGRSVADVAAVADPQTGVAMYDSALYGKSGGWSVAGGTSVSAPIVAALYALSGDALRGTGAQTLYAAAPGAFSPVTAGANGRCRPAYLCTAGPGYSGPGGLGVPQGLTGF